MLDEQDIWFLFTGAIFYVPLGPVAKLENITTSGPISSLSMYIIQMVYPSHEPDTVRV